MIHGKDFSSRSLPVVSVAGGAGSSSFPAGIASDTTSFYRGGHASTLVRKSPMDEDETTLVEDSPASAPAEERTQVVLPRGGDEVSSIKIATELTMEIAAPLTKKEKKEQKFKAKSAAKYAKTLKSRNHTNIRRKVMHACFGLGFATMNHLIPRAKFVPGMAVLTGATLLMELLRYRKHFGWMNDALHWFLGSSLRKHEMEGKFTGSFYFFLGVTVTSALFPTSCATMGICQLALADPSASYFGKMTRDVYWSRIEKYVTVTCDEGCCWSVLSR
jgi:hypothetical protein